MARRPKRKYARKFPKRGKYLKGNIEENLQLSTLGAQTLVSDTWDETVAERTLITSIRAAWSLDEMTTAAGDGPIACGIAHSDYTDAEIEEVIEITGSWDEGNLISQERAKRKVRVIGIFRNPQDSTDSWVLNDGRPIKTKLNWVLTTGDTLKMWAYNMGSSALASTDPQLKALGHANLFPL